jgi:predicted aspartyl protease
LLPKGQVLGEIHSQYRDGLIWLKVDVTGKSEPLNFLLDLGAVISVIDLQTARSLGVHLGNRQIVQGVNGQGFAYRVNDLQAVAFRQITGNGFPADLNP